MIIEPIVCPKCGNSSNSEKGISLAMVVFRSWPVHGQTADEIVIDYDDSQEGDVPADAGTTMKNIPNNESDLRHLFCNACNYAWYDPRGDRDIDRNETRFEGSTW